jgi:hypothetical protein
MTTLLRNAELCSSTAMYIIPSAAFTVPVEMLLPLYFFTSFSTSYSTGVTIISSIVSY